MKVNISLIKKDMEKLKKKKPHQLQVIVRYLQYLSLQGYDVSRPKADNVRGKIFELRPLDYRILYAYDNNRAIALVLLEKKSNEIPKRYIDLAEQRLFTFLSHSE